MTDLLIDVGKTTAAGPAPIMAGVVVCRPVEVAPRVVDGVLVAPTDVRWRFRPSDERVLRGVLPGRWRIVLNDSDSTVDIDQVVTIPDLPTIGLSALIRTPGESPAEAFDRRYEAWKESQGA